MHFHRFVFLNPNINFYEFQQCISISSINSYVMLKVIQSCVIHNLLPKFTASIEMISPPFPLIRLFSLTNFSRFNNRQSFHNFSSVPLAYLPSYEYNSVLENLYIFIQFHLKKNSLLPFSFLLHIYLITNNCI